jgi:hypothetical protein
MSTELTPKSFGSTIAGRQYELRVYECNGRVMYYQVLRDQESIIDKGSPQKVEEIGKPERLETESEIFNRLIRFYTELHRREAEAQLSRV